MKRNLHLLTTTGFLLGLSLLLANDFLFKQLFHNWLTGKLSDFAGLFIFPLFWTAFAPRHKRLIYLLVSLLFLFWKSPYSQPLIDWWNGLTPLTLARKADASDLVALIALIPSYKYQSKVSTAEPHSFRLNRGRAGCLIAVVSVFAFTATSYSTKFDYSEQEFIFADTKAGLIKRLEKLQHGVSHGNYWSSSSSPDEYTLAIKTDFCFGHINALVEIKEQNARQSRLVLRKIGHDCPKDDEDKEKLLIIFNHEVIERLQNDIDAGPSASPTPAPLRKTSGSRRFY
jgi:hypothetical protein